VLGTEGYLGLLRVFRGFFPKKAPGYLLIQPFYRKGVRVYPDHPEDVFPLCLNVNGQKHTDEHVRHIDELIKSKEAEIMEV